MADHAHRESADFLPPLSSHLQPGLGGEHAIGPQQDGGEALPRLIGETLRSDAQPLSTESRGFFEPAFKTDFSGVRIHADDTAAAAAQEVGAPAFTVGRHVVFGANQYAPGTAGGKALLAHELAHAAQQPESSGSPTGGLRLTESTAGAELAAQRGADAVMAGGTAEGLHAGDVTADSICRAPPEAGLGGLTGPGLGISVPLANVEVQGSESATKDNPKLLDIAQSYKANAGLSGAPRVRISANLPSSAQYDSAQEKSERAKLAGRMRQVRDALVALGVPADAIDISPASAYATSANGQVSVQVSKLASPMLLPPLPAAVPPGALPGPVAPAAPAAGGLPSIDLDVKIGPVTVSIPKEVRAKLPISLKGAKSLVVDIGYEVPAKFSLKLTLDGTPYLRVSVKAGAEIDTKNASATGSVGLVIETTSTTYNAVDPGETRLKLKKAGEALNKAAQEYAAAGPDDKLGKAIDIASALGEIYDAVDKAGKKATPVPRATFEFGYKKLLTPGDETDRSKLPPSDFIGGTATFHF